MCYSVDTQRPIYAQYVPVVCLQHEHTQTIGSDAYLLPLFPECMIFYGIAAATYFLFLRLARDWPQLLVQWSALEQTQCCYGTPRYLRCKIRGVTAALLFGAAGIMHNHLDLVLQVVSVHDSAFFSWQGQDCAPFPNVQPGCAAHRASYLTCTGSIGRSLGPTSTQ
jgi:hypothetical protein